VLGGGGAPPDTPTEGLLGFFFWGFWGGPTPPQHSPNIFIEGLLPEPGKCNRPIRASSQRFPKTRIFSPQWEQTDRIGSMLQF
jgi:hypothetical protein